MNIFLYEYFTATVPQAKEILEGKAMLATLINSFLQKGHRITTIIHNDNLKHFSQIKGLHIHTNNSQITKIMGSCNAALIIAPETGGILEFLTRKVEKLQLLNLGSSSYAVTNTANKYKTYSILLKNGIHVPQTELISANDVYTREISFPLILKPVDGAGSRDVFLLQNQQELAGVLNSRRGAFLLQEYISGEHLSVTVIVGKKVFPVSINTQEFSGYRPFNYTGGKTLIRHRLQDKILKTAIKVCTLFSGLRGFIGIDIVIRDENIYVIEINPRPTTPLVSLSRCLKNNIADLLLDALSGKEISPSFCRCENKILI